MANPEHLAILAEGVDSWNRWRKHNPHIRPWLTNADLSESNLPKINLSSVALKGAKLIRCNLAGSNLRGADLEVVDATECNAVNADLSYANLRQTKLGQAKLYRAILTSANIRKARLVDADLSHAVLSGTRISRSSVNGTNFFGALLYETLFIDLNLSEALALSDCQHRGPSVVDRRTLLQTQQIPVEFLRGCGLSDWEIEAAKLYRSSLSMSEASDIAYRIVEISREQPVQFYSAFISYSHADAAFAGKLYAGLQAQGIRCWLDEKQLRPGDDIYEQVDRGVRLWDKVLLCCSEASLASWWCNNELGIAFDKEQNICKERNTAVRVVIPINLDGYLFSEACTNSFRAQMRRRLCCDFTGWATDRAKFDRNLPALIHALRADAAAIETPPISRL